MAQQNNTNSMENLVDEGRKIVRQANRRHVMIRNADGTVLADVSATVLAIILVAMFVIQPFGTLVAIGAIAYGIYAKVKIEVVHELSDTETVVEVNLPEDE